MKNSHAAILAWMTGIMMFLAGALVTAILTEPEDLGEPSSAVLHFSNSSHRDLNVTVYALGDSEWDSFTTFIINEQERTVNVRWYGTETAIVFIHIEANDIDEWMVITVSPGEWRGIILW